MHACAIISPSHNQGGALNCRQEGVTRNWRPTGASGRVGSSAFRHPQLWASVTCLGANNDSVGSLLSGFLFPRMQSHFNISPVIKVSSSRKGGRNPCVIFLSFGPTGGGRSLSKVWTVFSNSPQGTTHAQNNCTILCQTCFWDADTLLKAAFHSRLSISIYPDPAASIPLPLKAPSRSEGWNPRPREGFFATFCGWGWGGVGRTGRYLCPVLS